MNGGATTAIGSSVERQTSQMVLQRVQSARQGVKCVVQCRRVRDRPASIRRSDALLLESSEFPSQVRVQSAAFRLPAGGTRQHGKRCI